ncbi:MAG TPA: hypothetical protein VEV41_06240, partial [Terriglobales bacterium]|nr:hypothetical protein [Terriglobales bacterium]
PRCVVHNFQLKDGRCTICDLEAAELKAREDAAAAAKLERQRVANAIAALERLGLLRRPQQ